MNTEVHLALVQARDNLKAHQERQEAEAVRRRIRLDRDLAEKIAEIPEHVLEASKRGKTGFVVDCHHADGIAQDLRSAYIEQGFVAGHVTQNTKRNVGVYDTFHVDFASLLGDPS